MNSSLETALDIKSHTSITNPFVLKLPANSTSRQLIQLSISSHILKKMSLIDFSQSRELADLYKECLLDVIQNPLLDLSCIQTVEEILHFLQQWQLVLAKGASWPHTRTCFYFLQEKLKKAKLFQQLDCVRLKRAQLQPNKKEFLTQIMAQNIHSEKLKAYIVWLKEQIDSVSENSLNFSLAKNHLHQSQINENIIHEQESFSTNDASFKNILYSDTHQDWNYIANRIKSLTGDEKSHLQNHSEGLKNQISELFETYVFEKLPVFINQMKNHKSPKEKIIQQLSYRKSVIQMLGLSQLVQILNVTVSKLQYADRF